MKQTQNHSVTPLPQTSEPPRNISALIPAELYHSLSALADNEDRSMGAIVRLALAEWIDGRGRSKLASIPA